MDKRAVNIPTETIIIRNRRKLIFRVLVISSIVIYTIETLLMVLLEVYLGLNDPEALVLDGLILIILLFPINYIFIARPMSRQITERDNANLELMKSNELLERFFAMDDILIAYMDKDFNFIRVNQAYAATDARAQEEFIGKNYFDLYPNDDNLDLFQSVIRTGKAFTIDEKPVQDVDHPERGVCYCDWTLLPVKDPQSQVVALILVLKDVTEQKKAQLALSESERRFSAVFNQTFQQSALLDATGKVLYVNQTALDFTGLTSEDILGQFLWHIPWWDFSNDNLDEIDQIKMDIDKAADGMVMRSEYQIRSANGRKAVMDITIKPFTDNHGSTLMLIYEARDITTRIQTEEAIKEGEVKVKRLYKAEQEARQFAETLRNAILELSGSLDSETVLATMLDHLYQVVPYTSAHILLLEDEDHLIVRFARGEEIWEEESRLLGKRFDLNQLNFLKPLLEQKETLTSPDTFLYDEAKFLPSDAFVRSWLGIPLLAGEQVVGVCLLEHHCNEFFHDNLVRWATALTRQAASTIQKAWLFDQVRDGREQLQALSRRLVEVQENERNYIARELHDEAGQALASLKIGLSHLEKDSNDPAAIIAHSQELKQIADDVLENLHRLAIDLRPASLDHLGLVAALRQYAERVGVQQGLAVQFETVGGIERLPSEMETAIYRIVQEALTNVVRHAQATRIDILLERHDGRVIIVVEDDGVGFDTQTHKVSRLGVLGMQERAVMLGGTITIESSPARGTSIILEVPWQSES